MPDLPSGLDAGEEDVSYPDAAEAEADAAEMDAEPPSGHPCDYLERQNVTQTFVFNDVGPCPWGQGDNSPLETALGWSARTEQIEQIPNLPSTALLCGASFEVPQTEMWFDDAMVIALGGVVLMSDVNVSVFDNDGTFFFYDWARVLGSRGSGLYCLDQCSLPPMETPGPMSLEISSELARRIGERAAAAGTYDLRVVTVGDNDANDCRHQPFDFVVSLDFVVP
jgi:hypothetical protein